jgi:putative hydrolase of the HAD superfamily
MIEAVLWDFGGVILSSPFEAFNDYEMTAGLPRDFIRTVNSTNPDANAWALLERSDISPIEFDDRFASESAALGHRVPGADVLGLLAGAVRPEMVVALDRVIAAGFATACLTNNVLGENPRFADR